MANTTKVYQGNQLWNLNADSGGPSAIDVLLNVSSNLNAFQGQVVFQGHTYVVEATGAFAYNPLRISLNDVVGTFNSYAVYRDGIVWETRTTNVPLDLNKILFTDFNYQLASLQGDDVFLGSSTDAKNDYVRAEAGNDLFTGYDDASANGGDYFYGGTGRDTSIYRGRVGEYTIAKSTTIYDAIRSDDTRVAGYVVTDKTTSRDGTDKLIEVERLHFNDLNVALDIGVGENAGMAYRMYRAALNRTPDPVGLGGWIKVLDDGGSLASVASGFIHSTEFEGKYGINPNSDTFVTLLYKNVLHRLPDTPGLQGWTRLLETGYSKEQVLIGFSESNENIQQTAQLVANGIQYQEWLA